MNREAILKEARKRRPDLLIPDNTPIDWDSGNQAYLVIVYQRCGPQSELLEGKRLELTGLAWPHSEPPELPGAGSKIERMAMRIKRELDARPGMFYTGAELKRAFFPEVSSSAFFYGRLSVIAKKLGPLYARPSKTPTRLYGKDIYPLIWGVIERKDNA